jgi:hypothetical protein
MKRLLAVVLAVVVVLSLGATVALAAKPGSTDTSYKGNGAPSGAHFNLNLIGVPKEKTADMNEGGSRIFVKLEGNTKILLTEGDSFLVLDPNGTDGEASFQLPNPDPDNTGTTLYSVYVRALGKPGGTGDITTWATAPGEDGIFGTADDEEVYSIYSVELDNSTRPGKFTNVSKELLYIYVDLDGVGGVERYPLFDEALQDYFWSYDNNGLKVVQLRFYYDLPTTVPAQ